MSHLLYIQASPRGKLSSSSEVAESYLEAFTNSAAENTVSLMNIWDMPLPEFDEAFLNAKYRVTEDNNPSQADLTAWQQVIDLTEQFKQADCYLFSVPMWNFSIPYKLKHFLDVITQSDLTFSVSNEFGFYGLVTGKPVTIIYSRGGEYSSPEAKGMDFQKPFLEMSLGFIGFREINSILIEPTMDSDQNVQQAVTKAKEQAQKLGANSL